MSDKVYVDQEAKARIMENKQVVYTVKECLVSKLQQTEMNR